MSFAYSVNDEVSRHEPFEVQPLFNVEELLEAMCCPFWLVTHFSKQFNPLTIWLVINLRRIIIEQIERSADTGSMETSPRINSIALDQSKALRADSRRSGMSGYVIRVPSIYLSYHDYVNPAL